MMAPQNVYMGGTETSSPAPSHRIDILIDNFTSRTQGLQVEPYRPAERHFILILHLT